MIATVALVTVRELCQRGWALAMVVLLPLFLLRLGPVRYRVSFLVVGAGWAVATLALFSYVAARPVERRLRVAGARPVSLHLGRQIALSVLGLGVATVAWVGAWLARADRPDMVALALVAAVLVGVPLGGLVAQVVTREMDGTLVMIALLAITLTSQSEWTHILPFWSAQEFLGSAAAFGTEPKVGDGLRHAGVTLAVLSIAAWWAHRTRLARSSGPTLRT
jgi:hypothetical protein